MSHKANIIRAGAFGRELGYNGVIVDIADMAGKAFIQEVFHSFSLAMTRNQARQRELTAIQVQAFERQCAREATAKTIQTEVDLPELDHFFRL